MNQQFWWYLSRAGGIVTGLVLVASMVLGVLMATRALKPHDRPAWMLAMHRWFSALTMIGIGVHVGGLVADSYVHFGWVEVLVPMGSAWKPGAVTIGVIAMYLLIGVQLTSLVMRRLPRRTWHLVHLTSYVAVWLGFVHAGLAGTDVSNRVYQVVALSLAVTALSAVLVRILLGSARAERRLRPVRSEARPADEGSGELTAVSPVGEGLDAVLEGVPVAGGGLHQPTPAGR